MNAINAFRHDLPVYDSINKVWIGKTGGGSVNPQPGDVYVDQLLTNLVIGFMGDPEAPAFGSLGTLPVRLQSSIVPKWSRADTMRLITELRVPGTRPNQAGVGTDNTTTYFCKEYGLEMPFSHTMMANAAGGPYDVARARARMLTMAALRRREANVAANVFLASTWTGSSTGADITPTTLWSADGSDPVRDVEAQYISILEKTGLPPTHLLMGARVKSALRTNAAVLARYRAIATTAGAGAVTVVDDAGLDAVFRVKVLESHVTTNSASPGATISMGFTIGKHALLCRMPAGAVIDDACSFRTIVWESPEFAGAVGGMRIVAGSDAREGVDWMQIHDAHDVKVTAPETAAYFPSVVT